MSLTESLSVVDKLEMAQGRNVIGEIDKQKFINIIAKK